MDDAALRALEFDRIAAAVRAHATTPTGRRELAAFAPSPDPVTVARLLAETSEAVRFLHSEGGVRLRGHEELESALAALAIDGRALEADRLLQLSDYFASVDATVLAVRGAASAYPRLTSLLAAAASFRDENDAVRRAIDAAGEVVDDASPRLRSLRDQLRRQRGRLRTTLETYLRGRDTASYLQDQVVTERNGRFVIVVKAEHRGHVPGIVHGASASGASVYVEPLATVDINNDIVALEDAEAEEVHRILLALTDRFRTRHDDVERTVAAATAVDIVLARARYSRDVDGVEPHLSTDGTVDLRDARHPLLKAPVPVTIRLAAPQSVLLITGPNTGGKTVALKTVGLLALMVAAGLRIPVAAASAIPVFRTLFTDIGDDQSIEANLSTFSAHVSQIAAMDRALQTPALVLLDEVGSGTDPIEGGALGVAVVDHFRQRGATVVATSHYDALKTYASTTEGVVSAAFGFNPTTYAPTYELIIGSPGRSLALEIAARIGLRPSIVTAARANLSAREAHLASQLARLDEDLRRLAEDTRQLQRERQGLAAASAAVAQREASLRAREERARGAVASELQARARDARREIDQVIATLKVKAQALAAQAAVHGLSTGATGSARSEARAAVDAALQDATGPRTGDDPGRAVDESPAEVVSPALPSRPLAVGDRVRVAGLGVEGIVVALPGAQVEVDVHGKRMRMPSASISLLAAAAPPGRTAVRVNVELQPRDATPAELNVIGCTVDEALARAERFLDESLLHDLRVLRFVHGHGTGQLRRALASFLQAHPLVAHISPAPPQHGGGGVTVAELRD